MVLFLLQDAWGAYVTAFGDTITTRVLIPWIIMMIVYWTYGLALLYFLDMTHYPTSVYKGKHQAEKTFSPAGNAHSPALTKCIRDVLFNQFFVILPGLLLIDFCAVELKLLPGLRVEPSLPTLAELALQTVLSLVCVEIGFYYSHRLLHYPAFYSRIHKIHHEFIAPYGIAAVYAHPIEVFVGNTLCVMGPAWLINMHLFNWYLAIVIGWIITINGHAGYALPPKHSNLHDLHHEFFNCNYGTFGVLDYLHGTVKDLPASERNARVRAKLQQQQ